VIVIADATPLIALAKINKLSLLKRLFGTLHIPPAVYAEVVTHAPRRPGADEVREATWIQTTSIQDTSALRYLRAALDPGEAETLILAEEMNADWVLLDESKARRIAKALGLSHIGTVGLLLLAKRRGYTAEVRPLLDELRMNRFHLSDKVYRAVLRQAGE
jgi:predicted nucleic acid-binding protein